MKITVGGSRDAMTWTLRGGKGAKTANEKLQERVKSLENERVKANATILSLGGGRGGGGGRGRDGRGGNREPEVGDKRNQAGKTVSFEDERRGMMERLAASLKGDRAA